ncbi:thioredoxin H-type-like [Cucurbita pepo subsp. pepo]|uniref:thioredoxin H-type-like n=1 Tax=Cucurbita pepo subsp. pepo TaxID=3664 RepID=UPI000C9D5FD2|nr:thioredoxin H-type-like [Cucurbita pepo subsp. pepo]
MAQEGNVIACRSTSEWNAVLLKESGKLIVVHFTAPWCGPRRLIAPYFSQLAKNHPSVIFLEVDVDELKRVAFKWDIEALPTFIFLKRGQKSHRIVGTDRAALLRKIEELKTPAAAASTA